MTKYLDKSFTVCLGNDNYSNNWENIFGKKDKVKSLKVGFYFIEEYDDQLKVTLPSSNQLLTIDYLNVIEELFSMISPKLTFTPEKNEDLFVATDIEAVTNMIEGSLSPSNYHLYSATLNKYLMDVITNLYKIYMSKQ